jgi:putative OPT family oligopeptide transporter
MNESFKPYIASSSRVKEFSFRAIVLGSLLGLLFAVGNAYLGLKIGTTVSASIPAAVFSMALLSFCRPKASILENNLVQTIASVGEALAAGAIFTIPALFLIGEHPSLSRIFLLSALGGILGILFMIPMRRYIIVHEHGTLPFPEGTACAEILKTGEEKSTKAFMAGIGMITGTFYKVITSILFVWNEVPAWTLSFFQRTIISMDCTPALMGVGYLVGPRTSCILFAGGALGWLVLIPLISFFGTGPEVIYPATISIPEMSADDLWSYYIRYIGLGAVAMGGIFSIFKIIPIIKKTLHMSFKELFQGPGSKKTVKRTDKDISLRWLVLGSVAVILTLWLFPSLPMNFLTILLLVVLGFFFVAVTSLTVGIIGSTSNPVSGMTITTLLLTCLIFVALGWTERIYMISALTMGVVACTAICLASTTSQDLKTGYILGATPKLQQIGEIIGIILPALAIGGTLYILNAAYGFGTQEMPAPQGTMLALIADGIMNGQVPFVLILSGVLLALLLTLIGIPVLPFAMGLYLPFSLSTGMLIGGIVHYFINKSTQYEKIQTRGILAASGLVAGDAVTGVIIALLTVIGIIPTSKEALLSDWVSLGAFIALGLGLGWIIRHPPSWLHRRKKEG